jgi:ketosteroid isomerase-like protein
MTTTPEQEIRAVIDERVGAVKAKDTNTGGAEADDVVTFDVLTPLNARGKDSVAEKTQALVDSYDLAIGYDVDQLEIHVSEGRVLLVRLSRYRHPGLGRRGEYVGAGDARPAAGRRRLAIVHDHGSVPWDPQTSQGLIDRSPT